MMDSSHDGALARTKKRKIESSGGGGDRLSKLNDRALGHVLSFLPAEEAARAALLSSRWRHVFGAVHTVTLDEPESAIPITSYEDRYPYTPEFAPPPPAPDPNAPPPYYNIVSAAIIARQRQRGAVPLRRLRVAVESYSGLRGDSLMVDQWVSYAVQQAAAAAAGAEDLDLDLRLCCRLPVCDRPYALRRRGQQQHENGIFLHADVDEIPWSANDDDMVEMLRPRTNAAGSDDGAVDLTSDDDEPDPWPCVVMPEYIVTSAVFSCAHLRSLSLSSCWPALPDAINLPSLVTLLLSNVSVRGSDVEQLVAGCPRLADLTLEACRMVTTVTIMCGASLRRLALRCCNNLKAVAIDSSELQAFEYRGGVTDGSFLTMHGGGGGGSTRMAYGKVDICGEEATSEVELVKLRQLLHLFVHAKHLHLESARLGSGLDKGVPTTFPCFSSLIHLEMRGCLPDGDDDDGTGAGAAIAAVSTVLEHAPNLETLSLAFHPQEYACIGFSEEEVQGEHHLRYNPRSVLATPSAMIPCLRNKVREINLVHYQGGTAQRALAKFLLSNAPVLDRLWCRFAEGPMWTQTQLMQEMKGWVINKLAETRFA